MNEGLDVFGLAEKGGVEALDAMVAQGPPRTAKAKRRGDPKANWKQTNIRMDPEVKRRMRRAAGELGVPLEELIHVGLLRLLEDLEAGKVELEVRETVTKRTLLAGI